MISKRSSPYSSTPVVPAKKIAGKNPVPGPALGGATPTIVPTKIAFIHGFGPEARPFRHPSVHGAHGWGHVAKERHGHLRVSGNPRAHQLGRKK